MDNRKSFEKILIMLHLEGTNSTRNVQETRNRKNGKKKNLKPEKAGDQPSHYLFTGSFSL